ncbi:MAG: BON domain-containing protein [Pseudomonadales bacterium]
MYIQSRKLLLAAGVALAIAATSNVVIADNVTDARQETQIWTTYLLSPYLSAYDIQVTVHDGKATLTGKVDEDVNKDLAKQIALGVNGIKEVDNQIMVEADYVPPKRTERSYGEVVDDATITAAVKSKLLWSKHTDGLAVDVDTRKGRVTLQGTADSGAAKELAGNLAMNTRGVISVNNKLVIDEDKPKTAQRAISDTWITTKVMSTLRYSSNVSGSDVAVTTDNGIVSLSGKVDSGAERALAIELAKNVRGVQSVNSNNLTF